MLNENSNIMPWKNYKRRVEIIDKKKKTGTSMNESEHKKKKRDGKIKQIEILACKG